MGLQPVRIQAHRLAKEVVGIVKAFQFAAGNPHPGDIIGLKNQPSVVRGYYLQKIRLRFRAPSVQFENRSKLNQTPNTCSLIIDEWLQDLEGGARTTSQCEYFGQLGAQRFIVLKYRQRLPQGLLRLGIVADHNPDAIRISDCGDPLRDGGRVITQQGIFVVSLAEDVLSLIEGRIFRNGF